MKTTKTESVSKTLKSAQIADSVLVAPLFDRMGVLTVETLAHPQVKDKTPLGVASRVARHLNKEGYATTSGRKYWTGYCVIAEVLGTPMTE